MSTLTLCQVIEQAQLTAGLAASLVRQLRKLRRILPRCDRCPQRQDCPERQYWNSAIDSAITTIAAEWSLD